MAKARHERDDYDDSPKAGEGFVYREPPGGLAAGVPAEDAAALLARIAELERELAGQRALVASQAVALAVAPPDTMPPGATGYWAVGLKYGPTHVVKAPDPANAWNRFREEMGVVTSEFQPEVVVASRDDYRLSQARRRGLRPDEFTLPEGE